MQLLLTVLIPTSARCEDGTYFCWPFIPDLQAGICNSLLCTNQVELSPTVRLDNNTWIEEQRRVKVFYCSSQLYW